ncbi:SNF2, N-terminal [Dillenia turbinata]|uniref:DNA helicase n=1 Tax=Dillenia turbinata TaxID=194707 RepID=A0AAN8ZPI1_9MAGN
MAAKGPRSKLDHESRARRQKALEPPKEPRRPKTHWDHVLEEMVWLSKDFEAERKWKLSQAKKVALRASKGMLDQATRGEKRLKEEEHRMRKVALNISKDVKKFWLKIEKLASSVVHYKHQLEFEERKKKALDKQLEFLLGQTERYSTMLAENLVDPRPYTKVQQHPYLEQPTGQGNGGSDTDASARASIEPHSDDMDHDENYDVASDDDSEDDEHTIEEDEALITKEERQEELEALQSEMDLPLEELLKRYATDKASRGSSPEYEDDIDEATELEEGQPEENRVELPVLHNIDSHHSLTISGRRSGNDDGNFSEPDNQIPEVEACQADNLLETLESDEEDRLYDFSDENDDGEFLLATGDEKDDETTLVEEEELEKTEQNDPLDEIALLQKESEIPIEELIARYKKDFNEVLEDGSEYASAHSDLLDSPARQDVESMHITVPKNDDDATGGLQAGVHSPTKQVEPEISEGRESDNRIADAAAAARSAQPTGNTFSTTKVRTKFPFLLKHPLREYQHIGLDWLVTMYEKRLNGILADEMGLGKTIMTIALLAHLACEKGIWGPHLIVVPTSVMLNWETEFLKWCPAFKILTYFGSAKERKYKRQGWMKPNSFHVCITTYRLVIQDSKVFKRKKWKYLILDEAHLIKNWKSQRWQTLLNFNSKRRILLTGTPLQNDLMELWSLMHFLMPHIFQSHQEFKDWFCNPISGMVEGQEKVNKEVIDRLHNVLRPFILRRLKRDVEKQLPMKHEHVIYCRLSKRQRHLYEDFIASSETQATLASANFFGMISIIMQLRKVCNHPDLFEGRPIVSSFDMAGLDIQLSSQVCSMLSHGPFSAVDLVNLGFLFTHLDFSMTSWETDEFITIATPSSLIREHADSNSIEPIGSGFRPDKVQKKLHATNIFEEIQIAIMEERFRQARERAAAIAWWNSLHCHKRPMYSTSLRELVMIKHPLYDIPQEKNGRLSYLNSDMLANVVLSPVEWFQRMIDLVESFMFSIPAARAPPPVCWCSKTGSSVLWSPSYKEKCSETMLPLLSPIRPAIIRKQVYFPDRRLIQFDCGKLQELAVLLRRLKSEGHRALIFTQMTKMLDILEAFINLYGYTYMRLDGSTQPEERQTLMQRFNTNPKFFLFILSTRSGGVGINLVGADTVIFYDSDWNPAMDQQAQDRCHRIGQTREVHIYRLISESTIEENILKKAHQKRALDDLVIQSGGYNTQFFKKLDPMELFSVHQTYSIKNVQEDKTCNYGGEISVSNADVEAALKYAEDEADYMALKRVEQEEAVDNQEFTEEAIGKMEDDEFVNEDDTKVDDCADRGGWVTPANKESGIMVNGSDLNEEKPHTVVDKEDDMDMLADVKQMAAAAAAAGQEISLFENQLRPIDRYAMRFLELWDPIIDRAAIESQVRFEEREWELDRIEKFKEDMEAEIDEDEEPLVYERWDADFATEAYRQQVEALAQHQLMEELEYEAREREDADEKTLDSLKKSPKPKSKKKSKKAKFKSLKKSALASEPKDLKEEEFKEQMSVDDEGICSAGVTSMDAGSPLSTIQKKRKKIVTTPDVDEEISKKKSKKSKKARAEILSLDLDSSLKEHGESKESKSSENMLAEVEQKQGSRSKMGGKFSITAMPVKRVLMIKPEKLKKGNVWSRDCFPSPDSWTSQEDAILCAVVHEYGPNWSLASETLYGMTAGGFYRGRFRHPVHCCERFRELIQKYVLSASDNLNSEKVSAMGSGKALLKVTEDNVHMLLDVAAEMPDNELLLQKHFTALLSSVWRVSLRSGCPHNFKSIVNNLYSFGGFSSVNQVPQYSSRERAQKVSWASFSRTGKSLLAAALRETNSEQQEDTVSLSHQRGEPLVMLEELEITLEFQSEKDDPTTQFPSIINLSVLSSDQSTCAKKPEDDDLHFRSSSYTSENRFRAASLACIEGSLGWASSAFPKGDVKSRSASKLQLLGKHKLSTPESAKPSKTKSRKTAVEPIEIQDFTWEPVFHRMPAPDEVSLKFDMSPAITAAVGVDDFNHNRCFGLEDVETESSGLFEHQYIPDLISGLDDCLSLPEYTDIG